MEKAIIDYFPPTLVWLILMQIVGSIVFFTRLETNSRLVKADLKASKLKFEADLKDAHAKIEKNSESFLVFVKEEVIKLEKKDEQLAERQSRIELQILERLSELSSKVGKIEGMLTNLPGGKS
jgi:hypothetical protein